MATNAQQFVVKAVTESRGRKFYNEVGRLFIRETQKGISGTLYVHFTKTEYAVFPVEPNNDDAPGE